MPFKSVGDEMKRFKAGKLHSGKSGKVVKSRKQALAIALNEARLAQGVKKNRKVSLASVGKKL